MHIDRHAQFITWHMVWLVKENYTSVALLEFEWHVLMGHVMSRWYFIRKYILLNWQSIVFFYNITWHFGFEVKIKWNFSNIHTKSQSIPGGTRWHNYNSWVWRMGPSPKLNPTSAREVFGIVGQDPSDSKIQSVTCWHLPILLYSFDL